MLPPVPAIVTYPVFRETLLTINAFKQQLWACVQAFGGDYDRVPHYAGAALFPYSRFHVPWIGYLGPSLVREAVSPPEIWTERALDGGLLISATSDRLDPADPEHLRRGLIVAETMISYTGQQQGGRVRV